MSHSCAQTGDGAVWCWGDNRWGQLGDGTTVASSTPIRVTGIPVAQYNNPPLGAKAVSTHLGRHTCALVADGSVWCWGLGSSGELGNGSVAGSTVPTRVLGLPPASSVTTGWAHSCALTWDGAAYCWGLNLKGQLGDGTFANRTTPVRVLVQGAGYLKPAHAISAGGQHTCALLQGGGKACWGDNGVGQIGLGVGGVFPSAQAVPDYGFANVSVAAGLGHSCGVFREYLPQKATCWGDNSSGQLGNGTWLSPQGTPTLVLGWF